MTSAALPTFEALSDALNQTSLKMNASQVHGLICGLLSRQSATPPAWEALIMGEEKLPTTHALLQELYTVTSSQLDDYLFEFHLVLPNDDALLPERAECLTLWCQGFLTGMKIVNIPIEGRAPSDVTEAINDLIEIAKMHYEEVVASEEDEAAYEELVEFVRMAAILIYQESSEKKASPSIH